MNIPIKNIVDTVHQRMINSVSGTRAELINEMEKELDNIRDRHIQAYMDDVNQLYDKYYGKFKEHVKVAEAEELIRIGEDVHTYLSDDLASNNVTVLIKIDNPREG